MVSVETGGDFFQASLLKCCRKAETRILYSKSARTPLTLKMYGYYFRNRLTFHIFPGISADGICSSVPPDSGEEGSFGRNAAVESRRIDWPGWEKGFVTLFHLHK